MDAIIIGSRTAHRDDPLLTVRPPGSRVPVRVVVDSQASLSPLSQLARTACELPLLVWTAPNAPIENVKRLEELDCLIASSETDEPRLIGLLRYLAHHFQATNVLVEGGGELLGHFFDLHAVDEVQVYIAPKLIGGRGATAPVGALGISCIADGPALTVCERAIFEEDLFIRARMPSGLRVD
jgi:diaminohydroxyphosphoribosylaminopyrimidine deaminase/5-amino-6-(5-phosphoribosylamino)uracil reductase